jgi:hypothetical protein
MSTGELSRFAGKIFVEGRSKSCHAPERSGFLSSNRLNGKRLKFSKQEAKMKLSISLSALLIAGAVVASSEPASAVVYCQYISYPAGCIVRPGVRLVARPVARAVTPGRPMNRGGPVNRVGRR